VGKYHKYNSLACSWVADGG